MPGTAFQVSVSGQLVKVNVEGHSLKQQSLVQLLCHNILFDYFPTQAVYGINTTVLVGPEMKPIRVMDVWSC